MKRALMLAVAPLSGFAQGTASAPLAGKLLITGSFTMAPMFEEPGKRFRTRHPGVVITVEAGQAVSTSVDLLRLAEGRHIVMVSLQTAMPLPITLNQVVISKNPTVALVGPTSRSRCDSPVAM